MRGLLKGDPRGEEIGQVLKIIQEYNNLPESDVGRKIFYFSNVALSEKPIPSNDIIVKKDPVGHTIQGAGAFNQEFSGIGNAIVIFLANSHELKEYLVRTGNNSLINPLTKPPSPIVVAENSSRLPGYTVGITK
jgi:hypothetical protein